MNANKKKISILLITFNMLACTKEVHKGTTTFVDTGVNDSGSSISGPITHGGEIYRSRARNIKEYVTSENIGFNSDAVILWSIIKLIYETHPEKEFQDLKPVFDTLFNSENNIFEELKRTKYIVKTFEGENSDVNSSQREDLFGKCYLTKVTDNKKEKIERPSSTEAKAYADVCVDAKLLAKESPTNGELVALLAGHELLHHYGYTGEDGVVAKVQDLIAREYTNLMDKVWHLVGNYVVEPFQVEPVQIKVGDKIELYFDNVIVSENAFDPPVFIAPHVYSSMYEFFEKEIELSYNLEAVDNENQKNIDDSDRDFDRRLMRIDLSKDVNAAVNLISVKLWHAYRFQFDSAYFVVNGKRVADLNKNSDTFLIKVTN